MRLADLVDLEVQLARDAKDEPSARARDEALGPHLLQDLAPTTEEAWTRIRAKDPAFRRALLERWVRALRERDDTLPGQRVERGQRLVGIVLTVLAILLGSGTMQTVLGIDRPVNVTHFVGVFVFLQIALVLLLLLVFLRSSHGGWFVGLVRSMSRMKWVDRFVPTHARRDLERIGSGLETHGKLYAALERWSLFAITQRFASLFLLSGLATFVVHVTFTHLTFGWATTLDLSPEQVHDVVGVLAWPWAAWLPHAVPDLPLIEASRNTLERAPGTEGWWTFLTCALVVWGLAPRLLLWTYGHRKVRGERNRLDHSQRALQRLYDRLLGGTGWEGHPEAAHPHGANASRSAPTPSTQAALAVGIDWRQAMQADDELRRLVNDTLSVALAPAVLVAGTSDLTQDTRTLERLAASSPEILVLLAEGADAPTKDLLNFLVGAREQIGPRVPIVVLLLDRTRDGTWRTPDDEDLEAWRHFLETGDDPHRRVERIAP